MDTRMKIESARDGLDDCQERLARSLDGAELPVESAAYLASAQRRITDAIADLDKASRYLQFDGAVQRLMRDRVGGTAVVDGKTGVLVS